jgi:hypothetical protein
MKKRVTTILIAVAIVIVSGGATVAALMWAVPKIGGGNQSATSKKLSPKEQAKDADAKAKKLLDETAKLGSGKEADKKTQEAADLFEEASKLYKESGDDAASYEAQANADSLRSRLAAEESFKKQQEAEWAKQKAAMDAAKAAMQADGQ